MSKSREATLENHRIMDLAGLPPLPSDALPPTPKTVAPLPFDANVVERLQANADRAVRPALTILAQERQSPSLYDRSIATVRGLLSMYSVEDLDSLLLSCDRGEREVLLKSLLKK